jgi:hypothetical protein
MLRTPLTVLILSSALAWPAAAQPPHPPPGGGYDDYYEGDYHEESVGPPGDEGFAEPYEEDYQDDGSLQVVEHGSPEAEEFTAEQGRGFEMGGHILIPFFLDMPGMLPGFGVQARIGWELPRGWTIEGNVGVQANRLDQYVHDDLLTAFWVGVGARYSFLNNSAFVPFVGANLQVSFWSLCLDGLCDSRDITAGFGVTPLVGVAWEISPHVAVELGVQGTLTFFNEDSRLVTSRFARQVEAYISPFLGGTYYF